MTHFDLCIHFPIIVTTFLTNGELENSWMKLEMKCIVFFLK